ncbi:Phosphotransferase enzyme family protein [Paenibacillus sophorae]|uniref:Phosphotransferase enzyme family protein n=1 Tax=Paenibacillus sophorae TaxID=1333845 RepID=A0A1H8QWD3_9BACL|nr:aminoglycoside phosphotransferase family protein [Paenibacillus sophorae]SEO58053.1 Phosphotransferase enzyme family protein [Paenibacillus sophorae]
MTDLRLIGQGRTADIFEYSQGKIIKLYKKDFPAEAINQELVVSGLACSLGIRTPEPFGHTQLDGRDGLIFQRISGVSLLSLFIKKPWTIPKYSKLLANLHAEIHTYEAAELNRRQKQVLCEYIQQAPLLTEQEKEKIIRYTEKLPDGNKLCHGDFHPDNVMFDGGYWIVDWMTGMSGNPAGDAARTVILLSVGSMPDGTPAPIKLFVQFLRNKLKAAYIKEYLRVTGHDYSTIDEWILPAAAARLVEWIPKDEKDELLSIIRARLKTLI